MTDALTGIACGILAAAAIFGIVGQINKRWVALQRGARAAGLLGTAILLAAIGVRALAAWPPPILDSAGRALGMALIGLIIAWLMTWRNRSRIHSHTSLWWVLGLAAVLAGWAEFLPAGKATPSTAAATAIGLPLIIAGGSMVQSCGQAMTILQSGYTPGERLRLSLCVAIVLAVLLAFCAQSFFSVASFWPETTTFKAVAGVWLLVFSARLVQDQRSGLWLTILSAFILVAVVLWQPAL